MPNPGLPAEVSLATLEALDRCDGNQLKAANLLGLNRETFRARLRQAKALLAGGKIKRAKPFEIAALPDGTANAEDLLRHRKETFLRVKNAKEARRLIDVSVKIDG